MKRIQSACIYKTIHFQLKDGLEHEAAVAAVRQEAAAYEAGLRQKNVGYRILEEHTQPDGSIRIKIKMQYNKHPLGGTWIEPPHATPEGTVRFFRLKF